MEFRVLGPVEVWRGGVRLRLGGPLQRSLVAALALRPGQVVSASQLVSALWGDQPPASVGAQIYQRVANLRKVVGPGVVARVPPGYQLTIPADRVDLGLFLRSVASARQALAEGRMADAAGGLAGALGLWRGPALGGTTDPLRHQEADWLEEARLAATALRVEAELALGRHSDLIGELTALVKADPLRERPRAQLMNALHGSGRAAEALTVYREGRDLMVAELGVEPGPELAAAHAAVLANELPALASGPAWAHTLAPWSTPAQLPPGLSDFTGRERQVEDLVAFCTPARQPAAVAVAVITGRAGVGKTALAVHAAHRLGPEFADGQLYAHLRGAGGAPADAAAVLAHFLNALGVHGASVPDGTGERAAMFRSRTAGRRLLVVLDDAASEAQVRPLLPGSASCAVVITSRMRLAGLEGARATELEEFGDGPAVELLTRIAGAARVDAEPEMAAEVVRLCGGLPLAVRIAGAKLAARPHWNVGRMAARLGDQRRRLDELALGDLEVRASLALSYQGLPAAQRVTCRRLALIDAPSIPSWLCAALLGIPPEEGEALAEGLVEARLLDAAGIDTAGQPRYRCHDLVRAFAGERLAAEESGPQQRQALCRVLGACLAAAEAADEDLPGQAFAPIHGKCPRWAPMAAAAGKLISDPAAWFEAEWEVLLCAVQTACRHGLAGFAWDLAGSLTNYCEFRSRYDDWRATHEAALRASRAAGDQLGEAVMLRGLIEANNHLVARSHGAADARRAEQLFRAAGASRGTVDALLQAGELHNHEGDNARAARIARDAAGLAAGIGYQQGEVHALHVLARISRDRGCLDEAAGHLTSALMLARRLGNPRDLACLLRSLGVVNRERGALGDSSANLSEALRLARTVGPGFIEASILVHMGILYVQLGEPQARELLTRALDIYQGRGSVYGQATALRGLGELELAAGRPDAACKHLLQSVALWHRVADPHGLGAALLLLSQVHAARGEHRAATAASQEAGRLFARIGNLTAAPRAPQRAGRAGLAPGTV